MFWDLDSLLKRSTHSERWYDFQRCPLKPCSWRRTKHYNYHCTSSTSSSSRQCKTNSGKEYRNNDQMGHIILEKYYNCLHQEAVNYLPISRWKHSPRQKRIFCHIGQEGGSPVHLPAAQKGLWQNRYLQVKRNERQKEHCHCRSSLIFPIDHTLHMFTLVTVPIIFALYYWTQHVYTILLVFPITIFPVNGIGVAEFFLSHCIYTICMRQSRQLKVVKGNTDVSKKMRLASLFYCQTFGVIVWTP